jgi:hypothetical protein
MAPKVLTTHTQQGDSAAGSHRPRSAAGVTAGRGYICVRNVLAQQLYTRSALVYQFL